jgi:hypothetical protein
MSDDKNDIRIAFRHHGETSYPVIKLCESEAEQLWAALNSMAKDLSWKDYESK